jgi:hypothetical protein
MMISVHLIYKTTFTYFQLSRKWQCYRSGKQKIKLNIKEERKTNKLNNDDTAPYHYGWDRHGAKFHSWHQWKGCDMLLPHDDQLIRDSASLNALNFSLLLFIIQISVIVIMTRILVILLKPFPQPKLLRDCWMLFMLIFLTDNCLHLSSKFLIVQKITKLLRWSTCMKDKNNDEEISGI